MSLPILYSFRRCPYAIRARLAIAKSGTQVALREIVLREKADAFLRVSASKTVPTLVAQSEIIDESFDIMLWALSKHDPEHWLDEPEGARDLVEMADGPFKRALDRTKYATRYPDESLEENREKASEFLHALDAHLDQSAYLFGQTPKLTDMAILPFVRQFAFIDKDWFDSQDWFFLKAWLERFLSSELFQAVMDKYPKWQDGDTDIRFPKVSLPNH